MTQITTISEFLLQAGTQYRVYDMARGIRQISQQSFHDLESGLETSTFPRQQHAWFGIVFWNKSLSKQHYIWFLKLPLDEQGAIVVATRNHFLQLVIEALGQELEHADSRAGQLPENPYAFTPSQTQLANFNSISRRDLALPDSEYFRLAVEYLQSPAGQNWQQLALQGLCDIAAHSQEDTYCQLLVKNLTSLHPQVRHLLLNSLENHVISDRLSDFIIAHVREKSAHLLEVQAGLRALSQSEQELPVQSILKAVLHSPLGQEQDILTLIAARHWQHLLNAELLDSFISNLALLDDTTSLFGPLFRDLVQIPILRERMLQVLRKPDKDRALSMAIGKLFGGEQG